MGASPYPRPGGICMVTSACGMTAYSGSSAQYLSQLYQQQPMSGIAQTQQTAIPPTPPRQVKGSNLFTEIAKDVKSFILEYRGVLYFLAAALIIDHLIFKGAFRVRLQSMADKIVEKVEKKIAA